MHAIVDTKRGAIEAIARRYGVRRLEVVGSAAREDDFDPEHSDVDFLSPSTPMPTSPPSSNSSA